MKEEKIMENSIDLQSEANNDERRILAILQQYKIGHLSVQPDIDPHQIEAARENFLAPDDEIPLAIYDSTSFGRCDNGVFFGQKGLYWKNDYVSTKVGTDHISYEDLMMSLIARKNIYEIALKTDSGEKIILAEVGRQTKPSKELSKLLNLLKFGLTSLRDTPIQDLEKSYLAEAIPERNSLFEKGFVDGCIKFGAVIVAFILIVILVVFILKIPIK